MFVVSIFPLLLGIKLLLFLVDMADKKGSISSSDVVSMQIITTKLNGSNYLLWAQAMKVALGARKKLKYIESVAPAKDSKDYEDWVSENYVVMSWLWNSMEPTVCSSVMFLSSAKEIWESVHETFSMENNVSRVYEVYQNLFLL